MPFHHVCHKSLGRGDFLKVVSIFTLTFLVVWYALILYPSLRSVYTFSCNSLLMNYAVVGMTYKMKMKISKRYVLLNVAQFSLFELDL